MKFDLGEEVLVGMDYDEKRNGILGVTKITKVDKDKGWYYTPLGKFKDSCYVGAKKVSSKGVVSLRIDSGEAIIKGKDYIIYNAYGYRCFTADYIIKNSGHRLDEITEKCENRLNDITKKKQKEYRTKKYIEKTESEKQNLENEFYKKLQELIRRNLCCNCVNKYSCVYYSNNALVHDCKNFDVEE